MAAPYYSLIPKTCRAVQCYIRAANLDGLPLENVFSHKDAESRVLPNVTVRADSARPMPGNPGTWMIDVKIWVATAMDTTPDLADTRIVDSDALAANVFDLFFQNIVGVDNSALADAITSAARAAAAVGTVFESLSDFKCDYVRHTGGIDIQVDDAANAYMDLLTLTLQVRTSTATES